MILSKIHEPYPCFSVIYISTLNLWLLRDIFSFISNFQVLLDGIYDEESHLQKLRAPNNVVKDVMPIVWEYLTWDWEVGLSDHFLPFPKSFTLFS